jgi:hypothetical protein
MLLQFLRSRAPLQPICYASFSFEERDLKDKALVFFIRDLTGVMKISIKFTHSWKWSPPYKEEFSALQEAARARADCCVQVVDNKSEL